MRNRSCDQTWRRSRSPTRLAFAVLEWFGTPGGFASGSVAQTDLCKLRKLHRVSIAIADVRALTEVSSRDISSPHSNSEIYSPKLRHVEFVSCWAPVRSPALRVLKLGSQAWLTMARPSEAIVHRKMLSANASTLTELVIRDALQCTDHDLLISDRHDRDRSTLANLPELRMPNLARLELRGCSNAFSSLMGSIRCTSLTEISINTIMPFDGNAAIDAMRLFIRRLRE